MSQYHLQYNKYGKKIFLVECLDTWFSLRLLLFPLKDKVTILSNNKDTT